MRGKPRARAANAEAATRTGGRRGRRGLASEIRARRAGGRRAPADTGVQRAFPLSLPLAWRRGAEDGTCQSLEGTQTRVLAHGRALLPAAGSPVLGEGSEPPDGPGRRAARGQRAWGSGAHREVSGVGADSRKPGYGTQRARRPWRRQPSPRPRHLSDAARLQTPGAAVRCAGVRSPSGAETAARRGRSRCGARRPCCPPRAATFGRRVLPFEGPPVCPQTAVNTEKRP